MARRDAEAERYDGTPELGAAELVVGATAPRLRAAEDRLHAAEQRRRAAEDRRTAACDREQAATERRRSLVEREMLGRRIVTSETDSLTGAHTRQAGLLALDRELDRCRRLDSPLVLTYVDVVGLKALNHSEGHGAGDELLKRIVRTMRDHLRSDDLIVRHGGDEFLCAMSAVTMANARERFITIVDALADMPSPGSIRTGFAELAAGETGADLIARADRELISRRHG